MKVLAMTCCCVDVYPEKNTITVGGECTESCCKLCDD